MVNVGINLMKIDLNPVTALNFQHYAAIDLIHEPLVYVDEDIKVVGALAESWKVSNEGKHYIFKLRKDRTFHDGSPVTVQNVKESFFKHLDATSESYLKAPLLSILEAGTNSIKILDKETITFDLKGPYPGFLEILAAVYILPAGYSSERPNGAGPYKVTKFNGTELNLSRANNGSFLSSNIDQYRFAITQTDEFKNALDKGRVDITLQAPLMLAANPPKGYGVFTSSFDLVSVMFYYNLGKDVWSKKENRLFLKSILLAAREKEGFLSQFDKPLDSLIHEGILLREYYSKKAAKVVREKPQGFPEKIRILAPNTFLTDKALESLRKEFFSRGIELDILLGKGPQLSGPASKGEFDLALFPYEAGQRDPDGFLFLFTPDAPLIRFFHLPTKGYMEEINKIKFNENSEERLKKYASVFQRMENDEIMIPFFTQRMPFLYSSDKLIAPKGHSLTPLSLRFFNKKNE